MNLNNYCTSLHRPLYGNILTRLLSNFRRSAFLTREPIPQRLEQADTVTIADIPIAVPLVKENKGEVIPVFDPESEGHFKTIEALEIEALFAKGFGGCQRGCEKPRNCPSSF